MTLRDVALMLLELRTDIVDGRITPAWPVVPCRDRVDAVEALRIASARHYAAPGRAGARARWRVLPGKRAGAAPANRPKSLAHKEKR